MPGLDETLRFIRERTAPARVPLVPELLLWQGSRLTPLWRATSAEPHRWDDSPYWAFPWPGGQVLARYVLDNPDLVRGRRVLDFGAGSGLVAIAAALAGAAEVVAADVDPFCRAAVLLNAELNGVSITFRETSPLDEPLPDADVVLAGDVFYERALASRATAWLRAVAARGTLVLAGDAWRTYAPTESFVEVAERDVPTTVEIEEASTRPGRVLRFDAPGALTALVCGHATLDRTAGVLAPGGSAYYAAHALASLGASVRVFTAAGPDLPEAALRSVAGSRGSIDALVLPSPITTAFENVYRPDGRRVQEVLAAAPPLDPLRIPRAWADPEVLLLAPVLGEVDPAAFLAATRARVVGLGVQGLVRAVRSDGRVAPRRWEPEESALRGIAVAMLGEDEEAAQPDLAARLAAAVPIVVVTRGARGCDVTAEGRTRRVGVHPARELDPTGAGDVFAAAFLFALAAGANAVESARLGAGAASIVVEGRGGDALCRLGEACDRAARVPVYEGAEPRNGTAPPTP